MTFSICTFNIAHGRGLAKSNWQSGSLRQQRQRLDQIAQVIFAYDIVILQEVDFRAPWTFFLLNQYKHLQQAAGFAHGMTLANHRLCPRAGIAVLSRFPLSDREVVKLPQYSRIEGVVGYRKHALACTVAAEKGFRLVGVHLDYRGRSVTMPAARRLVEYTKQQKLPVVLAGDFNSTPLSFPSPRDNQPTALDLLRASGLFRSHPETDPQPYDMTHPTDDPRCVIDWILIPSEWRFDNYRTLNVQLSDHRPVAATVNDSD